jgi:hypothetical protein
MNCGELLQFRDIRQSIASTENESWSRLAKRRNCLAVDYGQLGKRALWRQQIQDYLIAATQNIRISLANPPARLHGIAAASAPQFIHFPEAVAQGGQLTPYSLFSQRLFAPLTPLPNLTQKTQA